MTALIVIVSSFSSLNPSADLLHDGRRQPVVGDPIVPAVFRFSVVQYNFNTLINELISTGLIVALILANILIHNLSFERT